MRGVNTRPNGVHNTEYRRDHPPYEPTPVAELARFAARQPSLRVFKLSPVSELVPQLHPEIPVRIRGPAACSAPDQGEDNEEELHQQVERVAEALQAAALRLQAMDHHVLMLARQVEPSGEEQNQDLAAPEQTLADQAGLIAEGDVPSPNCGNCGLPAARLRLCPH